MAIKLEVLRRAYELHCSTDLTITEIERALQLKKGSLAWEITKVTGETFGEPTNKLSASVLKYLRDNTYDASKRNAKAISAGTGLTLVQVKNTLGKLKQQGLLRSRRYGLDRRICVYKAVI